jgi:hypothetical protein
MRGRHDAASRSARDERFRFQASLAYLLMIETVLSKLLISKMSSVSSIVSNSELKSGNQNHVADRSPSRVVLIDELRRVGLVVKVEALLERAKDTVPYRH